MPVVDQLPAALDVLLVHLAHAVLRAAAGPVQQALGAAGHRAHPAEAVQHAGAAAGAALAPDALLLGGAVEARVQRRGGPACRGTPRSRTARPRRRPARAPRRRPPPCRAPRRRTPGRTAARWWPPRPRICTPFSRLARRRVEARIAASFSPPAMQTVTQVPQPSTSSLAYPCTMAAISAKGFWTAVIILCLQRRKRVPACRARSAPGGGSPPTRRSPCAPAPRSAPPL